MVGSGLIGDIQWDDLQYTQYTKNHSTLYAYIHSKLANALFTKELPRQLDEEGRKDVTTYVIHPGWVKTDITRNNTGLLGGVHTFLTNNVAKTVEEGALTQIKVCTDPSVTEKTGNY